MAGKAPIKRCGVDGCKVRLEGVHTGKCAKCGLAVCNNHLFPSDHTCVTKAPAASTKTLELKVEKLSLGGGGLIVEKPAAKASASAAPVAPPVKQVEEIPVISSLQDDSVDSLCQELVTVVKKGRVRVTIESGRLLRALNFAVTSLLAESSILEKARTCANKLASAVDTPDVIAGLRKAVTDGDQASARQVAGAWCLLAMLTSRLSADDGKFFDDFDQIALDLGNLPKSEPWQGVVVAEFLRFRSADSDPSLASHGRVQATTEKYLARVQKAAQPADGVPVGAHILAGIVHGSGTATAMSDLKLAGPLVESSALLRACSEVCGQTCEPYVWRWTKGAGETLFARYAKGEPEVRLSALAAARAICEFGLGPVGIAEWVENLTKAARDPAIWRGKEFSLDLLELIVRRRTALASEHLPGIVNALAVCVVEAKKEVSVKGAAALDAVGDSVTNPETKRLMPFILDAIKRPEAGTDKCLSELMDATFVNSLNAASVALLVPVITRALREGSADLKRRGAIATGNVCALVRDVDDVRPFADVIQAELNKLKEHSSPEVRKAAEKSAQSLSKALEQADLAKHQSSSPRPGKGLDSQAKECFSEVKEALLPTLALQHFGLAAIKRQMAHLMDTPVRKVTEESIEADVASSMAFLSKRDVTSLAQALLGRVKRLRAASFDSLVHTAGASDEVLVDIPDMILAYASRVLLSKTHIFLKKSHRYGIVGKIGVGKTTLASRLAKGDLENFPSNVSTYMVLHEVLQEDMAKTVHEYMGGTPLAEETLRKVGFENPLTPVSTLSGGWRMRLAIARSMLADADLIVLDEPTNHVDVAGCQWLASYLKNLAGKTCVIVSHDYDFLEEVATDILHIHDQRMDAFDGGFKDFQKAFPEIAAALPKMKNPATNNDEASVASADPMSREPTPFPAAAADNSDNGNAIFELLERQEANPETISALLAARSIPVIRFPDPGKMEGITSRGKAVVTVTDLSFAYPSNAEKTVLHNVSCKLALNSRVALRGPNGQGKSTLMKLIVGELGMNEHSQGTLWKHHNLRVAYVAQHAIHHLLEHLDITPVQYLQRRYFEGRDKERGEMITLALDEADKKVMAERGEICGVLSRVTRNKQLYYEIEIYGRRRAGGDGDGRIPRNQKLDDSRDAKEYRSLAQLKAMNKPHVMKLIHMFDEEMKYEASGLALRPVTQIEILKGLEEFGIDSDFAERKIRWLSGGQKSRLVLAAAMWHKPHLICLDEPTNFLDAETLAVLTYSLKAFKGAVLTVSHHEAFVRALCNEAWDIMAGHLKVTVLKEKMKVGGIMGAPTPSPGPDDEDKI